MRRGILVLTATGVMAGIGLFPAGADEQGWKDGSRTTGPLDISWVNHSHVVGPAGSTRFVHTIRLFTHWPAQKLRHRGFIHVVFQLRGHPGNPEERAIWIIYKLGELRAEMYNTLGDPPKFLATVPLWRPDRLTIKVSFRKALLSRKDIGHYRWKVLSYIEEGHDLCGESSGCTDFVPNFHRYIRHDI